MSRLTREEARKVAVLSRLSFSDAEIDVLAGQLSDVLQYVEKLNELDTSGVEPTSHALAMTNVMREDVVVPSLPRQLALSIAPDQEAGCFRVPQVIQES
jgi:aspartyl-tRNA(Asn)/glutamyl-tRNA(Gln) amidotransferase subunit C